MIRSEDNAAITPTGAHATIAEGLRVAPTRGAPVLQS